MPSTDDTWIITNDADHASITRLGLDAAGNAIYQYSPAANYLGTDQVVIATTHEKNASGVTATNQTASGNTTGKCGTTNPLDDYVITININTVPN